MEEVEILNKLDHPNILRIYEVYQCPKRFYIVSELLTGGELFDQMINEGTFSEKDAVKVMK